MFEDSRRPAKRCACWAPCKARPRPSRIRCAAAHAHQLHRQRDQLADGSWKTHLDLAIKLQVQLDYSFQNYYIPYMARPREFDANTALDGAIRVFSEHGYEGTSAQMLVDAMGIGRQSLYDTFGDKWQLYRAALRRYGAGECSAHFAALGTGVRAIDGIGTMLKRVVNTANVPCLGIGSTSEFGISRLDLVEVNEPLAHALRGALSASIIEAQREGDAARNLDPDTAAAFLIATITGIRMAGRGGADDATLSGLADMAMRALR